MVQERTATQGPFGDGRTWIDVRTRIARKLLARFPRASSDDVDEALEGALVDLIEYWMGLPSAMFMPDDPERSFNFAVQRGLWRALALYVEELQRRAIEIPYDWQPPVDDEGNAKPMFMDLVSDEPTPEDIALEDSELAIARRVLAELSEPDLEDFFEFIATDDTERDIAARRGISHQAVHKRINVRKKHLAERAAKYGLA